MTRAFTTLAFSPSVRAAQLRYGSRDRMEKLAARDPERANLPEEMQERLRQANSIIVGTASHEGWPHVQHRGGPAALSRCSRQTNSRLPITAVIDNTSPLVISRRTLGCSCCCSTMRTARG